MRSERDIQHNEVSKICSKKLKEEQSITNCSSGNNSTSTKSKAHFHETNQHSIGYVSMLSKNQVIECKREKGGRSRY